MAHGRNRAINIADMRLALRLATVLVLGALAAPASASASGVIYAVTAEATPRLVSFDPAAPGTFLSSAVLDGGDTVHGADLRPATGDLYVLATDGHGAARIRTVNVGTGAVAAPISLLPDPADSTSPYPGLEPAGGLGMDFNPVADRLRITTAGGATMRVNPADGRVTTDAALNPGSPDVVGAAYTNSFKGATAANGTTLYDIDAATNGLVIQNPPNNGTLVPVGPLGLALEAPQDVASTSPRTPTSPTSSRAPRASTSSTRSTSRRAPRSSSARSATAPRRSAASRSCTTSSAPLRLSSGRSRPPARRW